MKIFIFLLLVIFNFNLLAIDTTFRWEHNPDNAYTFYYTTIGFNVYYHVGAAVPDSYKDFNGTGLSEGNSPIDIGLPAAINGEYIIKLHNFNIKDQYSLCMTTIAKNDWTGETEESKCTDIITHTFTPHYSLTNSKLIKAVIKSLINSNSDISLDEICSEAKKIALDINSTKSKELAEIIQLIKMRFNSYKNKSDQSIAADISNAYELEVYGDNAEVIINNYISSKLNP